MLKPQNKTSDYEMMRVFFGNIIFLLLLGCLFAGFIKCPEVLAAEQLQLETAAAITAVSPKEAQQLIWQREDVMVVDVRTMRERKQAAIADSIHVPLQEIFQNKITVRGDRPLLLYCAVGGRSSAAADWLQKQGFTEIYNLAGGIIAWQKQG